MTSGAWDPQPIDAEPMTSPLLRNLSLITRHIHIVPPGELVFTDVS